MPHDTSISAPPSSNADPLLDVYPDSTPPLSKFIHTTNRPIHLEVDSSLVPHTQPNPIEDPETIQSVIIQSQILHERLSRYQPGVAPLGFIFENLNQMVTHTVPKYFTWLASVSHLGPSLPKPIQHLIELMQSWVETLICELSDRLSQHDHLLRYGFIADECHHALTTWINYSIFIQHRHTQEFFRNHLPNLSLYQHAIRESFIRIMNSQIPTIWLDVLTNDRIDEDTPSIHRCLIQLQTNFPDCVPQSLSASSNALTLLTQLRSGEWPTSSSCFSNSESVVLSALKTPMHPQLRVCIVIEAHKLIQSHRLKTKCFSLIQGTFDAQRQFNQFPFLPLYSTPEWDAMVNTCHQKNQLKALKLRYRLERPTARPYDIDWLKGYNSILYHYPFKPSRYIDAIDAWIASDTHLDNLTLRRGAVEHDIHMRLLKGFQYHSETPTILAAQSVHKAFVAKEWGWLSRWAKAPKDSHNLHDLLKNHLDVATEWLLQTENETNVSVQLKNQADMFALWQKNNWVTDQLLEHLLNGEKTRLVLWKAAETLPQSQLEPLILSSLSCSHFPENSWKTLIETHHPSLKWADVLNHALGDNQELWEKWGQTFYNDVIQHCPLSEVAQATFNTHLNTDASVIDCAKTRPDTPLIRWLGENLAYWNSWMTYNEPDCILNCTQADLLCHLLNQAILEKNTHRIKALLSKRELQERDRTQGWLKWIETDRLSAIDVCDSSPCIPNIVLKLLEYKDENSLRQLSKNKALSQSNLVCVWKGWLTLNPTDAISACDNQVIIAQLAIQLQSDTTEKKDAAIIKLIECHASRKDASWWQTTLTWVCEHAEASTRTHILNWLLINKPDKASIQRLAAHCPVQDVIASIIQPNPAFSTALKKALYWGCKQNLLPDNRIKIQNSVSEDTYKSWIESDPTQWATWIIDQPDISKTCPPDLLNSVFNILKENPNISFLTLRNLIVRMSPPLQLKCIRDCRPQLLSLLNWPGQYKQWAPYLDTHELLALSDDFPNSLTSSVLTDRIQKDPMMADGAMISWLAKHAPTHLITLETSDWYQDIYLNTLIDSLSPTHPYVTSWWSRAIPPPHLPSSCVDLYLNTHSTLPPNWLSNLIDAPPSIRRILSPPVMDRLLKMLSFFENPSCLDPLLLGLRNKSPVACELFNYLIECLSLDVNSLTESKKNEQRQVLIGYLLNQLEDKIGSAEQAAYTKVSTLKQNEKFTFPTPSSRINPQQLACMVGNSIYGESSTGPVASPEHLTNWLVGMVDTLFDPNMHQSFKLTANGPKLAIDWLQSNQSLSPIDHWYCFTRLSEGGSCLLGIGKLILSQSAFPKASYVALIANRPSRNTWTLYCVDPQAPSFIHHTRHTPIHRNKEEVSRVTQVIPWAGREIDGPLPDSPPNWWINLLTAQNHTQPISNWVFYNAMWSQVPGKTVEPTPGFYKSLGRGSLSSAFQLFGGMTLLAFHLSKETPAQYTQFMCLLFLGVAEDVSKQLADDAATTKDVLTCSSQWLGGSPLIAELQHELTSRCLKYLDTHPEASGFSSTLITHTIRLTKTLKQAIALPINQAMGCQFNKPPHSEIMRLPFLYIQVPTPSDVPQALPSHTSFLQATLAELCQSIAKFGYTKDKLMIQYQLLQAINQRIIDGLDIPTESSSEIEHDEFMSHLISMGLFLKYIVNNQSETMIPSYAMWHPISWNQIGLAFMTLAQAGYQAVCNDTRIKKGLSDTGFYIKDEWKTWVFRVSDPDWIQVANTCKDFIQTHQHKTPFIDSRYELSSIITQHSITPDHPHYCPFDKAIDRVTRHPNLFNSGFKGGRDLPIPFRNLRELFYIYDYFFELENPSTGYLPELEALIYHRDDTDNHAVVTTHQKPPHSIPHMPTSLYLHLNMAQNKTALIHHHGVTWASRMTGLLASRSVQLEQLSHRMAIGAALRDWLSNNPTMGPHADQLTTQLAIQATLLTKKGPLCSAGLAWIASILSQIQRNADASSFVKDTVATHIQSIRDTLIKWAKDTQHFSRSGIILSHWMLTYQFDQDPTHLAHWFAGLLLWRQALSQEKTLYCPSDTMTEINDENDKSLVDIAKCQKAVIHTCHTIIWAHLDRTNPFAHQHLSEALLQRNISILDSNWVATKNNPYLWENSDQGGKWHVDTSTGMVYRNGVPIDKLPSHILEHPDYQAIRPTTPHDWHLVDNWYYGQPQDNPSGPRYKIALVDHNLDFKVTRDTLMINRSNIPATAIDTDEIILINSWISQNHLASPLLFYRYQSSQEDSAWLVERNSPKNRMPLILEYEGRGMNIQWIRQWLPYGQTWIKRTIMACHQIYFLGPEYPTVRGETYAYFRDILLPTSQQLIIKEETKGLLIPSWIGECQFPAWLHDPTGKIWQGDRKIHLESNRLGIQSINPTPIHEGQEIEITHKESGSVLPLHEYQYESSIQDLSSFEPHNHTMLLQNDKNWELRFLRLGLRLIRPKDTLTTPNPVPYCPELGNAELLQTMHPPIWVGFSHYLCLVAPENQNPEKLEEVPFKLVISTRNLYCDSTSSETLTSITYDDDVPPQPAYIVGYFNPVSRQFDSDSILGRLVLAHLFYLSANLTPNPYTQLNGYEMTALLLDTCQPSIPFVETELNRLKSMLTINNPHRNACAIRLKIMALLNLSSALTGFSSSHTYALTPQHEDISRYMKSQHRIPHLCHLSAIEWERIPPPELAPAQPQPFLLNAILLEFKQNPSLIYGPLSDGEKLNVGGSVHILEPLDPNCDTPYLPLDNTIAVSEVLWSWLNQIQTCDPTNRHHLRDSLWASGSHLKKKEDLLLWAMCMSLTHCHAPQDWHRLDPYRKVIEDNIAIYHIHKYPNIRAHLINERFAPTLELALNHLSSTIGGQRAIKEEHLSLSNFPLNAVRDWHQELPPSSKEYIDPLWARLITRAKQASLVWELLNIVATLAIKYAPCLEQPPQHRTADCHHHTNPLAIPSRAGQSRLSKTETQVLPSTEYTAPITATLEMILKNRGLSVASTIQNMAHDIKIHCHGVLPGLLKSLPIIQISEKSEFPLRMPTHSYDQKSLVDQWVGNLREQWGQLKIIETPSLSDQLDSLLLDLGEIQTAWKPHEKKLVVALEEVLCRSVNNPQGWRFQMKRAHGSHPFMLKTVYMRLLTPSLLSHINPFIPEEDYKRVIEPLIRVLIEVQNLLRHTDRCIKGVERLIELKQHSDTDSMVFKTANANLYRLLTHDRLPKKDNDDEHALFDLYNNLSIRSIQRDMIDWLFEKNKVVTQMNMGEGKSSIILMVLLLKLISKKKLAQVVVPAPLLNDVTQLIKNRLAPLTNVKVLRLPITRDTLSKCLPQTRDEVQRQLDSHPNEPLVILTTPEEALGLRLSLEEAILINDLLSIQFLRSIQQRIDHIIIDEVDDTLNLTKEMNFTWGDRKPIQDLDARVMVPLTIFHELACKWGVIPHQLPTDDIDRLISQKFGLELPKWDPNTPMLIKGHSTSLSKAIDRWRNPQLSHHVLSLRPQVEYGLCINNPYDAHMAIPYEGKDTPLINAIFEHTDVRIGLSILAYYHSGLLFTHWMALMRLATDRPYDARVWWAKWIDGTECAIKEWEEVNVADETQAMTLHSQLGKKPIVIKTFITHIALANITEFESKLSADGTTLTFLRQNQAVIGFSGTTTAALPSTVAFEGLPDLAETDVLTLRLFANPAIVSLRNDIVPSNSMALIEALTHEFNADNRLTCVLDAGALITGCSNQTVATKLSRGIQRNGFQGVVFFGESGEVLLMRRDSDIPHPFSDSDYKPDQIITYVNDIRTRGTDRQFPPLGRGILTVGDRLANDRLTQAAMRLRQLGQGQSVELWVSERIKKEIATWSGQSESDLTPIDVYGWSMWQSACRDGEASSLKESRYKAAESKAWVVDTSKLVKVETLLSHSGNITNGRHNGALQMRQHARTHVQQMQKSTVTNTPQNKGHTALIESDWSCSQLEGGNWDIAINARRASSMGWPDGFSQVLFSPNARNASKTGRGGPSPLIRPIQEYVWCQLNSQPCVLVITGEEAVKIRAAYQNSRYPIHVLQWHNPEDAPLHLYKPPLTLSEHQRLWVFLSIINGECGIHSDVSMRWLKTNDLSAETHWERVVNEVIGKMSDSAKRVFEEKILQAQRDGLKDGYHHSPLYRLIGLHSLQE